MSIQQPELREMAVADLNDADYNPRTITEAALRGLGASLERFGLVQPIVWNERTGKVVAGHQRLRVLRAEGVERTTVVVVDYSESEERAANVTLNNPHIEGEFVDDGLAELLAGLQKEGFEGFDELALDELLAPEVRKFGDPNKEVEPEAVAVSALGDVWLLGPHRVMCGDSTDPEAVKALFGEAQPGIMVTDPPYGVEYDASWRNEALGGSDRAVGEVANDDQLDWTDAWRLCGCDVAYVWHADVWTSDVEASLKPAGFLMRARIIWAKNRAPISQAHYHWKHETALYAYRKGKSAQWSGARDQTTLWEIDALRKLDTGHSTQKPVECMARPLRNHEFELAYDPFLGSGTTIIAGEQEGVAVFGMELKEVFVDVIVRRWQEFTEQAATLEATGQTFEQLTAERLNATE